MLLLVGGCASSGRAGSDDLRVAFGAGQVIASATATRTDSNPIAPPQDLEDAWDSAGFVGVTMGDGTPALDLRLVGARSEHRVADSGGDAELTQVMWFGLLSAPLIEADWLKLSVGGGLGVGFGDIEFRGALAPPDRSGLATALTAMVEAEFGRHALLGVMAWDGLLGEPGDTRATFSSVMVYGGWRF